MLTCTCVRGSRLCPVAESLWANTGRQFDIGKQTGDYTAFETARAAYESHVSPPISCWQDLDALPYDEATKAAIWDQYFEYDGSDDEDVDGEPD